MERDQILKNYSQFKELLEEYEENGNHIPDFIHVCEIIGAEPSSLENLIYKELGVGGDEIIASYNN